MKLSTLLNLLPPALPPAERALIERAYAVAETAHEGQKRASGEPYVQHCLAVAVILAELHMPTAVIAAGLLHDTVEDTALTLEDIRRDFGEEVATLVDGVTKLAQLPRVSKEGNTPIDRHKESLRKTFLAMSDDVRVVLIKLADRLHNMRTLMHVKPEKQERIARETLEIFAPLANRLGIWSLKSELEDLSFRYTNPERYREIAGEITEHQADRERTMNRIVERVRQALTAHNIDAEVSGRPKHIFSIFKKMERKEVGFDEVYDVRAVRVIVRDQPTCYYALGVIHNLWRPIPGQFDDYIATPKDNFYQSLHTAVVYEDGKTLEVQIRTPEMHESAEFGIAAHWRYKEGKGRRDEAYERRLKWLRSLMEWRQDLADAGEFVDAMKSDVFEDRVYCFTPRGDIIDLPAGATPIDFAYHVHTSVGDRCRGAKVNGKLVTLDYRLKTGDQVEVLTAKRGGPSRDWLNPDLNLVRSHRASQKIRQYFRRQDREQTLAQGRDLLERELKRLGVEDTSYETLARKFGYARPDDLIFALGAGDIHGRQIAARVFEEEQAQQKRWLPTEAPRAVVQSDEVSVLGTRGLLTNLARCCKPVPGDPIIGYITRGRGATIHRRDCPNVIYQKEPERIIKVAWGQAQQTYPVSVRITAYDRDGLMKDVSTIVAEEHINMTSLNVATKNSIATFEVTMEIADVEVLSRVLARIEQLPNVIEARRMKPG